jgi:hypothetical protein
MGNSTGTAFRALATEFADVDNADVGAHAHPDVYADAFADAGSGAREGTDAALVVGDNGADKDGAGADDDNDDNGRDGDARGAKSEARLEAEGGPSLGSDTDIDQAFAATTGAEDDSDGCSASAPPTGILKQTKQPEPTEVHESPERKQKTITIKGTPEILA